MNLAGWIGPGLLGVMISVAGESPERAAAGGQDMRERIHFSALDEEERPVLGLAESDFELSVNGRKTPLEDFHAGKAHTERRAPVIAWILLDFNPKIDASLIRDQADSAAAVFSLFHSDSLVGVKLVSDRSETLAPLTSDAEALRSAFLQFGERRRELRVGDEAESVQVGRGGILRAAELAIRELRAVTRSRPELRGRETLCAIVILSDGNVDPVYKRNSLYRMTAEESVFIYPVLMPRDTLGPWVQQYFELAKKTAGVSSVLGALRPGSRLFSLPRGNTGPNALTYNFIHVARDLNGKYSFCVALPPEGKKLKLGVKCRVKGVKVILPRTEVR